VRDFLREHIQAGSQCRAQEQLNNIVAWRLTAAGAQTPLRQATDSYVCVSQALRSNGSGS
jgi:hypothetical protein